MAAWMSLGRCFSLAPPALCSLHYSLRLNSNHPIGPSYSKRSWPVHFIVGWVGLNVKKTFGNKERTAAFLVYKHRYARYKPSMVNTMFRTPEPFDSEYAHDFLHKRSNRWWRPYDFAYMRVAKKLRRAFWTSTHRGMLDWRRAGPKPDLCIVEPYHLDLRA